MKCRVAPLGVLAGLVIVACGDTPRPTEPVAIEPSFNASGTTQCVGALVGGTFDNVEVPPGQTCTISNAIIRGGVKALENSSLFMENNTVGGSVVGDKSDIVRLFRDHVTGSVIIKDGVSPSRCAANVTEVTVEQGSIQIEKMTVPCVEVFDNLLGKGDIKVADNNVSSFLIVDGNVGPVNIQVIKNTGAGDKSVTNNQARGVLQCFDNTPPFFSFNPLTARREGQCLT